MADHDFGLLVVPARRALRISQMGPAAATGGSLRHNLLRDPSNSRISSDLLRKADVFVTLAAAASIMP